MLVQAETQEALNQIEAIAAVDGVDGVFIGPSDLAASLGHTGDSNHPDVQKAIEGAVKRTLSNPGVTTMVFSVAYFLESTGLTRPAMPDSP